MQRHTEVLSNLCLQAVVHTQQTTLSEESQVVHGGEKKRRFDTRFSFFFFEITGAALQKRGSSGVKGEQRGESEETTQYKCNCFFPPLPSVLSLVSDPVFTVNLYGPAGQRAPLTHYTLPQGPYNLYGNGGEEHGSLEDRECGRGRKREKVKMGGKSVKNEQSAGRAGNEEKKQKVIGSARAKRPRRKRENSLIALPPTIHSAV